MNNQPNWIVFTGTHENLARTLSFLCAPLFLARVPHLAGARRDFARTLLFDCAPVYLARVPNNVGARRDLARRTRRAKISCAQRYLAPLNQCHSLPHSAIVSTICDQHGCFPAEEFARVGCCHLLNSGRRPFAAGRSDKRRDGEIS